MKEEIKPLISYLLKIMSLLTFCYLSPATLKQYPYLVEEMKFKFPCLILNLTQVADKALNKKVKDGIVILHFLARWLIIKQECGHLICKEWVPG